MPDSIPRENSKPVPLLINRDEAARLCCVSVRTWQRREHEGLTPAPVSFGSRKVLYNRAELQDWINAGTPPREQWNCLKSRSTSGRKK